MRVKATPSTVRLGSALCLSLLLGAVVAPVSHAEPAFPICACPAPEEASRPRRAVPREFLVTLRHPLPAERERVVLARLQMTLLQRSPDGRILRVLRREAAPTFCPACEARTLPEVLSLEPIVAYEGGGPDAAFSMAAPGTRSLRLADGRPSRTRRPRRADPAQTERRG